MLAPRRGFLEVCELRALLADDNESSIFSVSNYLETFGIQAICACTRQECLELLEMCNVDVVIVDLVIDGCFSLTCVEKIREKYPSLPVIIWTGYTAEQLPKHILERFIVIYKPYCLEEVRKLIIKQQPL